MLQKINTHITDNFPFLRDKKLLIAISGGIDSVVLMHILNKLNLTISLAHCNFLLRGKESNLDEQFIKNLGKKLNLKVFTVHFKTKNYAKKNKLSTQVAARELRYNWFQELIEIYGFDYVLTAHQADDNLETFLINLTRGTGLEGLTGIPAITKTIVRPLLVFSREEIYSYALENNIEWREDASNAETKYIRNKIRHKVIPTLKEINPNLLDSFKKTSKFLQESQQIIDDRIKEISTEIVSKNSTNLPEVTKINIEKLQHLSSPKAYLYQFLKTYNFTEWKDVVNLLSAQSGKQIFSKTHRLLKDRNVLLLSKKRKPEKNKLFFIKEHQVKITKPVALQIIEVTAKNIENNSAIICIDKDLLKFPLIIRKWVKGDYFYPKGMKGKKKLSKFFKDEKFSLMDKENTWLLCNNNNTIIWVIGKKQDSRFITHLNTQNILKIETK